MFSEETIQKAKTLDFPSYLKASGLELIPTNGGSAFKALCPFHPDKNPSLSITLKNAVWLWHCFGCSTGGTPIDFVQKREGLGFREAVSRLLPESSRPPASLPAPTKQEPLPLSERKRLLSALAEHYQQALWRQAQIPKNGSYVGPKLYLEKRGLWDEELIRAFKIGFSDGTAQNAFKKERLTLRTELGIFKDNYWETFASSLIFPVIDLEGEVTDLYARRSIHYIDRANHCYNKGAHIGLWNLQGVQDADTVILTEGIIDALSIYKAGFKNVTALYGTSGYTQSHHELLKTKKRLVFALDNDESGRRAVQTLSEKLPHLERLEVLFPKEHKDANGVLVSEGLEALRMLVLNPLPLELPNPKPASEPNKQEPPKPALPIQEPSNSPDLIYHGEGLRYELRNAFALKNLNFLKLVVRVHKDTKNHTDRVDFYAARSRALFTQTLCKLFDAQETAIENDLHKITEAIERHYKNRQAPKTEAPRAPMTEEEKTEAFTFLKSKNMMLELIQDYDSLGYVGDNNKKALSYFCATSRKLPKPISMLIRSQSSTGKSFSIDTTCSLMPPEDVIQLTAISAKALYYVEPDALKHKFLAIDERSGMEDAEYAIRSLQSSGKLTMAVPSKNPLTGKIETTKIEREGPIAYVDGSTNTQVNPENANRCFEVYLDESPEQTARIQEEQRKAHTLEGLKSKPLRDAIRRKHQNAQRLLKPVHVVIPFVHLIHFPADWIRTRRDHDRFLNLIVVTAFLHQYRREHKEHEGKTYIEATAQDYAIAYKIAADVLWNTFAELDKSAADFYAQIETMVAQGIKGTELKTEEYTFTRRQARAYSKLPPHVVKNLMWTLTDLEYLDVKRAPQGSKYFYSLAEQKKEGELLGLTTPQELKAKLSIVAPTTKGG